MRLLILLVLVAGCDREAQTADDADDPCGPADDVERGALTTGAAAKAGAKTAAEGVKTVGKSVGGFFDGGSPAPLLAELQPDVHCKGTDYGSPERVPEYEVVRAYGGRTVEPHFEGVTLAIAKGAGGAPVMRFTSTLKLAVGSGSLYWLGVRDSGGAYLDGGKHYTLTIPLPV